MANNQGEGSLGDDFFEQILSVPTGYTTATAAHHESAYIGIGGSASAADHHQHHGSMVLGLGIGHGLNIGGFRGMGLPLGLNLDPCAGPGHSTSGFLKTEDAAAATDACNAASSSSSSRLNEGDPVHLTNLFPGFAQVQQQQPQPVRPTPPPIQIHQPFQGQPAPAPAAAISHPPAIRPRVRARRGQATDPHSIAERLRRERIAERLKALQELLPGCNKTDRAAMLDEIIDYVKFLRLQVKVLSMSRLGAAGAVAQLVADIPASPTEGEGMGGGEPAWEKWSSDGTEQQVAKLLEEDIGAAMQFLQSKALCIMPISLASAVFRTHPPDSSTIVKPESSNPP
ncbi:hypothetical protein Ancab_000920 [Ancistrocladus abbreviatus]